MRNESSIEVEKADEGVERDTVCRQWPILDGVVFGGGWTVAVRAEVEADPLDTVEEEVTFLRVE